MSEVRTGRIKRVVSEKGFGFIVDPASKTEYFFHRSGLDGIDFNSLAEGTEVAFDVVPSPKGPRAERVRYQTATA